MRFKLPGLDALPGAQNGQDRVMVSLFVDGMETNALPFHVLKNAGQD